MILNTVLILASYFLDFGLALFAGFAFVSAFACTLPAQACPSRLGPSTLELMVCSLRLPEVLVCLVAFSWRRLLQVLLCLNFVAALLGKNTFIVDCEHSSRSHCR